MIDSLNGELLERGIDHAVIDCHGVGYLVHLPATVMRHRPTRGNCRVGIHYSVRGDGRAGQSEHRLFGFRKADERQLFRKLIEFLELPALVITDLDSIDGTTKKRAPVASGHATSNATLS